MEGKLKYLEMIQGIINRMASNSFLLKGWTVTLVSGILALSDENLGEKGLFILLLPVIIFWGLDSYYLQQERLYRALYDKVRLLPETEVDYSMKASPKEFTDKRNTFGDCFKSGTELWFYGPIIVVIIVVLFYYAV